MTATITAISAALKSLYPSGELPKSINMSFNGLKRLKKDTNFTGDFRYVPIQNANPQGSSADFLTAQGAIQPGSYVRFQLVRVQHHGVARVTGEAASAAVKTEGAVVDLWDNETKGSATTEMSSLATYLYGTGDSVLGQILSIVGPVVTLTASANMNYFELGMSVMLVATRGFSPVVRAQASANAVVVGIDRRNRTLTFLATISTLLTGAVVGDFFVRKGDQAGAVAVTMTGLDGYVTAAPATLFGLNRSVDPVRLAGQEIDYTGWAGEDALVDASAQAGFQGIGYPKVALINNIDLANLKKSLGPKIVYDGGGGKADHSFSKLTIEGENGPIELLADPFCPRNRVFLVSLDAFTLMSMGGAPHLNKYDDMDFARRPDADAFEVRFVFYGNLRCDNPGPNVKLTNFGL